MSLSFLWKESHGAGETVETVTNLNFGSVDDGDLSVGSALITAGNNSFEKWLRGHFTTYSAVTNLKFWKSSGTYVAGETVKAEVNTAYATPTASTSSVATSNVPTSSGTALVPDDPGASPDYSGYIILQLQTTVSVTPAGNTNQKQFSLSFDES